MRAQWLSWSCWWCVWSYWRSPVSASNLRKRVSLLSQPIIVRECRSCEFINTFSLSLLGNPYSKPRLSVLDSPIVNAGMWPFRVFHGRNTMGLFWPRKKNPSTPEPWTHSIFSLGICKPFFCGSYDPTPPQQQWDIKILWLLQKKSAEVVHAQWPSGNTHIRWCSPINVWIICWDPKLYTLSSAVKAMGS